MNMSQIGLLFDIAGVLILALRSWSEFRVVDPRSITMGSRLNAPLWKAIFFLGYPFLVVGFALQFLGTMTT